MADPFGTVDPFQTGATIAAIVAGLIGVWSAHTARRSKASGQPADEGDAKQAAPAVAWLTGYYQTELKTLRREMEAARTEARQETAALKAEMQAEVRRLEEDSKIDAEWIAALQRQIWTGQAPPPVERPTRNRSKTP